MLRLTVTSPDSEQVSQVEVNAASGTFEDVKELVAVDFQVPPTTLELSYHGEVIPDEATLADAGVGNDDMLAARILRQQQQDGGPPAGASGAGVGAASGLASMLRRSLGRLAGGGGGDEAAASTAERADTDMMEQAYIEQQIAARNVQENMALALEEAPESFASVLMLYIDTEVNGVPVKTFVDSGAQTTVMSRACAERCGIMRLIDTRFAGVAVGVGSARILGRVHIAPMKIGSQLYNCSFTVLDGQQNMELLLGLDMLKKHQAMIDLRNDCLHIGEPEELVPFLPEADVPAHARLS